MDLHGKLARAVRKQPWLREPLRSILTRINWHEPGEEPDILLFASGRGGSTWLMEVIAAEPHMRFVNEPLHPWKWHRIGMKGGDIDGNVKMLELPDELRQRIRTYLKNHRATRIDGPYDIFSRDFHFRTNRRVLKLDAINASDIDALDLGYYIVYLLRHPIPTALSSIRSSKKGSWRPALHMNNPEFVQRHIGLELESRIRYFYDQGSELQRWVLDWCLNNVRALKGVQSGSYKHWLVLTYEELLLSPDTTIDLLARHLRLRAPERLRARVNTPSASTGARRVPDLKAEDVRSRVMRWRSRVDASEERRAFQVVEAFEFDAYELGRAIASRPYLHAVEAVEAIAGEP